MRITGGRLCNQRLTQRVPDGTRPSSERLREGVMLALQSRGLIEGRHILDVFSGTGILTFEALSRGATSGVLVEAGAKAVKVSQHNAAHLKVDPMVRVMHQRVAPPFAPLVRVLTPVSKQGFGLVFLDPPYDESALVPPLLTALLPILAPDAWVVWEQPARNPLALPAGFVEEKHYKYGDAAVVLAYLGVAEEQT